MAITTMAVKKTIPAQFQNKRNDLDSFFLVIIENKSIAKAEIPIRMS